MNYGARLALPVKQNKFALIFLWCPRSCIHSAILVHLRKVRIAAVDLIGDSTIVSKSLQYLGTIFMFLSSSRVV